MLPQRRIPRDSSWTVDKAQLTSDERQMRRQRRFGKNREGVTVLQQERPMKLRFLNSQAILITAALILSHAAAAAPVTNGNFEAPGATGLLPIGPGTGIPAPTGWTVGGPISDPFEVFYQNATPFGVIGYSGPSSVGFGGNVTTGGTLSQTFDTLPGMLYKVDYFVTDQQGYGGNQSVL